MSNVEKSKKEMNEKELEKAEDEAFEKLENLPLISAATHVVIRYAGPSRMPATVKDALNEISETKEYRKAIKLASVSTKVNEAVKRELMTVVKSTMDFYIQKNLFAKDRKKDDERYEAERTAVLNSDYVSRFIGEEEKLEAQKTSKLNSLCQNLPSGQKEGIAHDLSQLLCIMEKNTHGGLEPEDVKIIETNLPKWEKQIQEMRISLENTL